MYEKDACLGFHIARGGIPGRRGLGPSTGGAPAPWSAAAGRRTSGERLPTTPTPKFKGGQVGLELSLDLSGMEIALKK